MGGEHEGENCRVEKAFALGFGRDSGDAVGAAGGGFGGDGIGDCGGSGAFFGRHGVLIVVP